MANTSQRLAVNFTADGSSDPFRWSGVYLGHFYAQGTFGGGTATLEYSLDGTNWYSADATNLALSSNGNGNFQLPSCQLRITLSGSTSPDLDAGIEKISNTSR